MIAAGEQHCLAMDADGKVWSWGVDEDGELGDGPNNPRGSSSDLPGAVLSTDGTGQLSGVTAIAAGYQNSFALQPDGTILVWGLQFDGTTGQGGTLSNNQVSGQAMNLTVPTPVLNQTGNGSLSLLPLSAYQNLTKMAF